MQCGACKQPCKDGSSSVISCSKCDSKYHTLCLNMTREALRTKHQFICPNCKIKIKNPKTDSTPVRQKQQDSPAGPQVDNFMETTKKLCAMDLPTEVMSSFTTAIKEMQDVFISMKKEMTEFTKSLNYSSDEVSSFGLELSELKSQMKELENYKSEVSCLRAEVAELRQIIAAKDQRLMLKDVEITGLTENKSENLHQIVSVISSTLGVELAPQDVDDVKRVGSRKEGALERPRPVVLSLTRRAPRDQLLRAARVRRGLTTDMLSIPGNSRRVYLNEHLTKENRILFSKARKLGGELRFKYVWSSNGSIFMRRSETSSVLQVTSELVLEKLKVQNNVTE